MHTTRMALSDTDERAIREHAEWLRRTGARPTTIRHRNDNLHRVGARLPSGLLSTDPIELDYWQQSLGVSLSSVQTYTCHVRSFFRWTVDVRLLDVDPSTALPVPSLPRRLPRPMPERHVRVAMLSATGQMRAWLGLAGWCGLRAGEIARVRRDDLSDRVDGDAELLVDGKGGDERLVPVPAAVLALLEPYMCHRGPIFRREWSTGLPVTPNMVTVRASDYLRSMGLQYTLHTLRHRFATELFRCSGDVRLVQELLGHKNLNTTAIYVALSNRRGSGAVRRLAKSLPTRPPAAPSESSRRQKTTRPKVARRRPAPPSHPQTHTGSTNSDGR